MRKKVHEKLPYNDNRPASGTIYQNTWLSVVGHSIAILFNVCKSISSKSMNIGTSAFYFLLLVIFAVFCDLCSFVTILFRHNLRTFVWRKIWLQISNTRYGNISWYLVVTLLQPNTNAVKLQFTVTVSLMPVGSLHSFRILGYFLTISLEEIIQIR